MRNMPGVVRPVRVPFVAGGLACLFVLWGPLGLAGKALAGLAPGCSQSGSTVSCSYSYTGTEQSLALPAGVSSVQVAAVGAAGADGSTDFAPYADSPGGLGGTANGSVPVTTGETLYVDVGFPGISDSGGLGPGTGGGASDVRTVSCGASGCPGSAASLASRLVVAGGGGGGGGGNPNYGLLGGGGGNAEAVGVSGTGFAPGLGGGAGTSMAGGAGGAGGTAGPNPDLSSGYPGGDGAPGVGGAGGESDEYGGGGGGAGYFGGGGGGSGVDGPAMDLGSEGGGGGGGGGSSWIEPSATGASTGIAPSGVPASVTISYTVGPVGCTMTSTSNTTVFSSSGQSIHIENGLTSDTSQSQHLVLRSLGGPAHFFSLTSAKLTDASCIDNKTEPLGPGDQFNTFAGDGTGVYGTSYGTSTPGYKIRIEIGDYGEGTSPPTTSADSVVFTVTNSSGTVVWTGRGTLTSGSETESG